jgi:N-acetylmuramic acid 6-phosphate etherase
MVDVEASNAKLLERQEKILVHLTGRSSGDVRDALRQADGSVKVAVLLLGGCDLDEAKRVLDRTGGQLRAAVDLIARAAFAHMSETMLCGPRSSEL